MKRILPVIIVIINLAGCGNHEPLSNRESGEILFNGIQLSALWPPQHMDPASDEVMPVPYLVNPPEVIPINVGRQLFVDDFLIENTTMKRVYHRPEKHPSNPVFYPETTFEMEEHHDHKEVTYFGHGGLFYDPDQKHFKMFYTAGWRGGLALATSEDLIHWHRPEIGLFGGNIIIPPGPLFAGGDNAMWLDLNSADPDQKYKFLSERLVDGHWRRYFDKREDTPTHTAHISHDGKFWSQGVHAGRAADYCSFFYNPFRNKWVFSIKQNTVRGRGRYYHEHDDFLKGSRWDEAVFWVNADKMDTPDPEVMDAPQLYSLNGIAYESIILGQFYIHLGPHNKVCEEGLFPKMTEIHMGYSRDGFHWHRPDRTPFIGATRKEGDWDRAYLHGTNGVCLVTRDEIWFPYCGYSGLASDGSKGMYTGASIGMAILRRDGFASMEADDNEATLTTRPVLFDHGAYLFVNTSCDEGALWVELLDEKGNILPGFTKSIPISINSTIHKIEWEGGGDLTSLQGKSIQFRFHLRKGKLYSFWVSPEESGASYGFVGAGGPGYEGVVDTRGNQITKPGLR
ncbi:MAG TPA: hypothetical protein PKC30_03135 [Saprospiraceae bacterium]|nr:hypothetical protein [Saprospiraceae bacterium]